MLHDQAIPQFHVCLVFKEEIYMVSISFFFCCLAFGIVAPKKVNKHRMHTGRAAIMIMML